MYADFGDGVSVEFGEHGDDAVVVVLELEGFGDFEFHGFEAAVDVVEFESEEERDEAVVDFAGQGLVPGIVAYEFPAADEVVAGFDLF